MKSVLYIVLALAAVIFVTYSYGKGKNNSFNICDQEYALCTSAKCIPDPNNSGNVICVCEVRQGKSLGLTPCNQRAPYTDEDNVRHVISTFSLEDFPSKRVMTCPSGKPWANCLDQKCIVDPRDPSKAICVCQTVRTGEFQTLGGNCDLSTCDTGYWSGAAVESNAKNIQALMKKLGIRQSPAKYCQR
ncbi:MAG: hypothetical protein WB791_04825 [Waddliaceae bacterium]